MAVGRDPMNAAELQSLTSFDVRVSYGRNETTLDVRVSGRPAPVARLFKPSQYDGRAPFQLLAGPQLTELAGYITPFSAFASDRTKLGTVKSRYRVLRPNRWEYDQPGLPTLTARPRGGSSVRYLFPLSLVLTSSIVNNFMPFKFSFQAKEMQGFQIARATGLRARFTVAVYDPRIDRRLVLAAVVGLNQFESSDVRQEVVDLTANPFKA